MAGAALAREERWSEALSAFEQAAALEPHAVATYNIAFCQRALGQRTRAWRSFERALAEDQRAGGTQLTSDLRRAAREYADELENAFIRVVLEVNPPDLMVAVDGGPLEVISLTGERPVAVGGVAPQGPPASVPAAEIELLLDGSTHVFLVRHAGRTRWIERELESGVRLRLEAPRNTASDGASPPPAKPPTYLAPRSHDGESDELSDERIGALVLGSLGLAALGTGAALGGVAAWHWGQAQDACPTRIVCADDRAHELSSQADRYGDLATVGLVTGSVALAGALVLWLTAPDGDR